MGLFNLRSHVGSAPSNIAPSLAPFDLDISGVAGFFGGDATLAAMNTIHIYSGRRWMGWYNQPGTYEVAKKYGQLARSRFWDAIYPGPNLDPATLFKFDRVEKATKYSYAHWGATDHNTSYVSRLFLEECRAVNTTYNPFTPHCAMPFVTMVELPESLVADIPATVARLRPPPSMFIFAFVTIFFSLAAAVGCAVIRDWPCFAMIVLGMITNGVTHLVLSGRDLVFETPEVIDNPEAPRAGVLHRGNDLVVLTGPKLALRAITKGHYTLKYTGGPGDESHSHYHDIGICSAALSLQFLAQLLVVPQGELHGQLLFLASLAVSWVYNSYLSSSGLEVLLRRVFVEKVLNIGSPPPEGTRADPEKAGPPSRALRVADIMTPYRLSRHPARVVFAILLLVPFVDGPDVLLQVLDDLVPLNTDMWKRWKSELMRNIKINFGMLHDPKKVVLAGGVKFEFGPVKEALLETYVKICDDADNALALLRYKYGRERPELERPITPLAVLISRTDSPSPGDATTNERVE